MSYSNEFDTKTRKGFYEIELFLFSKTGVHLDVSLMRNWLI